MILFGSKKYRGSGGGMFFRKEEEFVYWLDSGSESGMTYAVFEIKKVENPESGSGGHFYFHLPKLSSSGLRRGISGNEREAALGYPGIQYSVFFQTGYFHPDSRLRGNDIFLFFSSKKYYT
ncbi:hypothetical protein KGV55_02140 [Candidatus Gracilibacteria bacterium]|nr:hypothetical protein [Candidatus Gracilibacteria bacterium]